MITEGTLATQPARGRGERLYPPRSSRIYWHLSCLRREIEEIIRDFIPVGGSASLVDYGCGNMPYRPLFEGRLASYIGCDFPGNEAAQRIITDPARIPVEDRGADLVLSTQVLEHVVDPARYLGECRRILRDGGNLILSTHGIWRYHPDPCDYWRWTSDGLKKIVAESGFEILRFRGIMGQAAIGLQLWQDEVLPKVPPRVAGLFTTAMQTFIKKADLSCPPDRRDASASVFVLVAKKPC